MHVLLFINGQLSYLSSLQVFWLLVPMVDTHGLEVTCVCVCLCVCVVLHQVPHGTTRAWSPHRATCCVINHQPEPEEALSHSPQRGEAECLKGYRAEGMGCIVGVGLSTWSQGDPATGGSPLYHWRTCKCPDWYGFIKRREFNNSSVTGMTWIVPFRDLGSDHVFCPCRM